MFKNDVRTLEALVAGDPGIGKSNFINRFLSYCTSSAMVRRRSDTVYFVHKPGSDFKIHLHDVHNTNIDSDSYNKTGVVFFCYAANDPESLRSLEKWIRLFSDGARNSFLVADTICVGGQDVAKRLSEEAAKLMETFGIKRLIECSFADVESLATIQTILHEVLPPKPVKKSFEFFHELKLELSPLKLDMASKQGFLNYGEEIFKGRFENRLQEPLHTFLDRMCLSQN